MTTLEILLIVLTTAVALLIAIVVVVLIVMYRLIRKVRHTTEEIQFLAERTSATAERFAPMGTAAVVAFQMIRLISKLRK